MGEKVCRLCLQTISNNHYLTIEESMLKTLRLNLKISEETVMCIECASCLQVFSKFTPGCVNVADGTLTLSGPQNDVKLDPVKIEAASNLTSFMETEIKCNFCAETHGREDLVPLNGSKENKFLMNTLEQYIWEMNLKNTEEMLTCRTCLKVLSFVLKCLDVEEKINKYIELKGTDDKGQIELKEVQQFIRSPLLKFETEFVNVNELDRRCELIKEEYAMETEVEMKYGKEVNHLELIIKTEGGVKSEQCDNDGLQQNQISNNPLYIPAVIPEMKRCKKRDERNLLTHEISSEKIFKCELCSYETKHKFTLNMHLLTHKNPSDIKMLKCELCPYEAKHKLHLRRHLVIHKSPSEIKMFKCELCSYEAKRKSHLKVHLLTHKNPSEIKMFKCELCPYKGKRKSHLKVHSLTHKSPSDIKMFKCEMCSYEAKQKFAFEMHLLTHKSPSEIKMIKCQLCSYEAKHKDHLRKHLLIHKSPSEIKMFKCEWCSYETKHRTGLKMHLLTHKNPSELKMFKCELCRYEAKRKCHLKVHLLTHKNPSEINMFKCDKCLYEAKQKIDLKMHKLTHKNPSELKMFKCALCSYETKRKVHLKVHLLIHRNPSKTKMFKCILCSYEAKRKLHLDRHLLTHKHPCKVKVL